MKTGTLYLIPTPISNNLMSETLLQKDIEIVSNLEYFVTESPKVARNFLKNLPLQKKIQELEITELSEHTRETELSELLDPVFKGKDLGLVSDAGIPSVADPGFRLVSIAQKNSIRIVPMVGPSSIFLALMASGLNGQNFAFNGYLPKEKGSRRKRIKTLERLSLQTNQTQIFMEAPYKNEGMVEDLLDVLEPSTKLCFALDIMGESEMILTKSVAEWRKTRVRVEKKPCLFLINSN